MPPGPLHIFKLPFACSGAHPRTLFKAQPDKLSIAASRFSACTQQHKGRLIDRETRAPKRKPDYMRRKEENLATVAERHPRLDNAQGKVDYDLDGMSPDSQFDNNARYWICHEVYNAAKLEWDVPRLMKHLRNTSRERCPYALPVPANVLCDIGTHLCSKVPKWRDLGAIMWDLAAAMGNHEAILRLSLWELLEGTSHSDASSSARDGIAILAATQKDFLSMTLHARNLSQEESKSEALAVAMELCRMTEPGQSSSDMKVWGVVLPLPWESWINALDDGNEQEWLLAWEYGAVVWDDPEACAKLALSKKVEIGTDRWLKYATKGAMGGDTRLLQDLGIYYLGLHGWYPKSSSVSDAFDSKIGFAWLELSAEFERPEAAANIWAGMALVLREHGDRPGGMEYLQQGLKQIENRHDIEAADKETAAGVLRPLIEFWNVQDLVNLSEQKIASTFFLKKPVVPVRE